MESSDDEEVVLVRRRPTAAAPRMHSDGEEEDARATAPVDASVPPSRFSEDDDTGVQPLDAGDDAPKPRLLRLKRRGDAEADGHAAVEEGEADEEVRWPSAAVSAQRLRLCLF
jgi:hypothetical protein